jgi:hypothetical protein
MAFWTEKTNRPHDTLIAKFLPGKPLNDFFPYAGPTISIRILPYSEYQHLDGNIVLLRIDRIIHYTSFEIKKVDFRRLSDLQPRKPD